ncbi:MAG: tRNA (guanosine(46)-N7)-methyltransferase TrmB [Muribaculaceae bacterium]|nr:tRNA (guanosine(46)-N7)-methyltransferase TrmB [Muribaculaceae bacterium]
MGKNKLRKFSELDKIDFVHQYPYARLAAEGFPLRGRWHEFFGNDRPIVLELGCGKGEYTVGLAQRDPSRNYIGIDIKGARMHAGATAAQRMGLTNVAFIRTGIEMLDSFFAPGEVDDIWITFPDPQMQKPNKRLTGTRFCTMYRRVAAPGCMLRLKTDSPFLYTYTERMARLNALHVEAATPDLYADGSVEAMPWLGIRTHYEQQWLDRGLTIKYLQFCLDGDTPLTEPDADDIPLDTYRSYSRGHIQMPQLMDADGNDPENQNH